MSKGYYSLILSPDAGICKSEGYCDGRLVRDTERALRSPEIQVQETKRTEIQCIFFGIHTANVVQLADRIELRARLVAA